MEYKTERECITSHSKCAVVYDILTEHDFLHLDMTTYIRNTNTNN